MKPQASVTPGGGGFLSKAAVAKRYGVRVRTIDRWKGNPKLEFPPPDFTINDREYRSVSTMEKWERQRAIASATP
jgi:hypothetical protein